MLSLQETSHQLHLETLANLQRRDPPISGPAPLTLTHPLPYTLMLAHLYSRIRLVTVLILVYGGK